MSINVSRNNQNTLNVDNNIGENSNIKIESTNNNREEFTDNNLNFIMNNDIVNNDVDIIGDNSNEGNSEASNENSEEDVDDDDRVHDDGSDYGNNYEDENLYSGGPGMSFEEIEKEKAKYLSKLRRLSLNDKLNIRRLNSSHSLQEIKMEVMRAEKDLEIMNGVQMYRHGLVFFSSLTEMGGTNLTSLKLSGWSNLVARDVDASNYDQVLEELYEIYGGAGMLRPEIKLMFMLGGSAYSFHISKLAAERAMEKNGGTAPSMNSFMNKFAGGTGEGLKQPMKGPSEDTDEILRRLEESDERDSITEEIKVQPKKRGRKKKTT